MIFYLGIHEPAWMTGRAGVPVMVSRRRLNRSLPAQPAAHPWVLDSGGFTELSTFGEWSFEPGQYADEVRRYQARLGGLDWCAQQDWMCEPWIVEKTGLSVVEHQQRTVANYLDLVGHEIPVIPVVQGYTIDDYLRHVEDFRSAGVNLAALPVVGLGSVCRRENTEEIVDIVTALVDRVGPIHGFGCKSGAISRVGHLLGSADSMAWSLGGRRNGPCDRLKSRCANHLHYALEWRERVVNTDPQPTQAKLF